MGDRKKVWYSVATSRIVPQQEVQAQTDFLEKPRPAVGLSIGLWG